MLAYRVGQLTNLLARFDPIHCNTDIAAFISLLRPSHRDGGPKFLPLLLLLSPSEMSKSPIGIELIFFCLSFLFYFDRRNLRLHRFWIGKEEEEKEEEEKRKIRSKYIISFHL